MMLGATSCPCGYQYKQSLLSMELTYLEALQAYWSIYWPAQLFSIFTNPLFVFGLWFRISGSIYFFSMSSLSPLLQLALQVTLSALGLFLYVHRAFGSFRGFSIFIVEEPNGNRVQKLNLRRRTRIWFYLFSRQIVAGVAAGAAERCVWELFWGCGTETTIDPGHNEEQCRIA